MKYTEAGISGRRDLEGRTSEVSEFTAPQGEAELAPYGSRIHVHQRRSAKRCSKAGELARQVLVNEHLSPQVARLAIWLMSYVLVQERDFDGALAAVNKTVALAPDDMFVLSRLMMVLVQAGRPHQALEWADQVAARDPSLGWSYDYGKGWALFTVGEVRRSHQGFEQTDSTMPLCCWPSLICAWGAWPMPVRK